MISRWIIRRLANIDPTRRRLMAARVLWGSCIGHVASHVVLVVQGGGFFEHVLMFISWGAVELTAIDILSTTDVKVDVAED